VAIFAAAIAVFFAINSACATDSDLTITEIMYNPVENSTGEKTEWLELYTKADLYIDPKSTSCTVNCQLKDFYVCTKKGCATSYVSPIYLSAEENNLDITHGEFIILAKDPEIFRKTYPEKSGLPIIRAGSNFNLLEDENGFIAISKDNKSSWIEEIEYGKYNLQASAGLSIEKMKLDDENEGKNWQKSCNSGGSPGEKPKECETDPALPIPVPEPADLDDQTEDPALPSAEDSDDIPVGSPEIVYSKNLKLSEVLPNPSANEDTGEFTEIYNSDPKEIIELSGWKLEDKSGNSYPLPDIPLKPGEYHAFYRNNSKFSLNNTGSEDVFLKNPDGEIVDHISYSGTAKENSAYALKDGEFQWTSTPTPGAENMVESDSKTNSPVENKVAAEDEDEKNFLNIEGIHLSEILPNPKKGSDEYIEIANSGKEPTNLAGWRVKDASKSKGYQFKESTVINPGDYLVIYRLDSKITLNNSGESVYLYNPKGEIVSSVSFDKSSKNSSYNFDGGEWKWSKYLTPGKENKFDSEPSVKVTKPKHAYKDLPTEFSAKAKDKETKKLKYAWDFGDGKKSYLKSASHKYLDTGKYTVTLSVADESQTVEKSFVVTVKKYPRPDLEIVRLVPNPSGKDEGGEIIDIKNNSSKKVDMKSWKIATGPGGKMYNHPISGELSIIPGETKTVTREFSKFSLNNKAGEVQIVMPDGKIVDDVEYMKDPPDSLHDSKRAEKIAEDEAYAKINGQWQWLTNNVMEASENTDTETEFVDDPTGEIEAAAEENSENNDEDGEVLGAVNKNIPILAPKMNNYTSEDAYIFLSKIGFIRPSRELNYCPLKNTTASLEYILISSI
jgi:hypothetical protein